MLTIVLLTISNIFMTFAWYGHLKHKNAPLFLTIVVSWGIAFFEYCFQVPANRHGSRMFATAQLKVIQEVITLVVFIAFSILYLRESLKWNYIAGFACILLAVFFVFYDFSKSTPNPQQQEQQQQITHESGADSSSVRSAA